MTAPWWQQAACLGRPTEFWYPAGTIGRHGADEATWRLPRRVCADCPVQRDCLDAAMREEAGRRRYGMRGGLTPDERARLARAEVA